MASQQSDATAVEKPTPSYDVTSETIFRQSSAKEHSIPLGSSMRYKSTIMPDKIDIDIVTEEEMADADCTENYDGIDFYVQPDDRSFVPDSYEMPAVSKTAEDPVSGLKYASPVTTAVDPRTYLAKTVWPGELDSRDEEEEKGSQ